MPANPTRRWLPPAVLLAFAIAGYAGATRFEAAQQTPAPDPLADPFRGLSAADGTIENGLFSIKKTGVTTEPVREAALKFIASLTAEQKSKTTYKIDDDEWRKWNNVHRYARQGVSFKEMTEAQRDLGFALIRAGLSYEGFTKARNAMKLNEHLAELTNNFTEYGEFLYYLTVMGTPSATEPWGWQLDGHHLVINYFVLGDQVVMTPAFMGAEPVIATSGKYAGTEILQKEQRLGLQMMRLLTPEQQKTATIQVAKTANNALAQAFRDNLKLDFAGIRGSEMNGAAKSALAALIREFVDNMDTGHGAVKMREIDLNRTYFAWIGGIGDNDVFYYRVHGPQILIEFDHQTPVALNGPRGVPSQVHVHTVVRTPNGNDYGKDLLRQHYALHKHE